jgi:hypothetical protein
MTLSAPVYAAALLRPCPGRFVRGAPLRSAPGSVDPSCASSSPRTWLVFSVFAPNSILRSRSSEVVFACSSRVRKASVSMAAFHFE